MTTHFTGGGGRPSGNSPTIILFQIEFSCAVQWWREKKSTEIVIVSVALAFHFRSGVCCNGLKNEIRKLSLKPTSWSFFYVWALLARSLVSIHHWRSTTRLPCEIRKFPFFFSPLLRPQSFTNSWDMPSSFTLARVEHVGELTHWMAERRPEEFGIL